LSIQADTSLDRTYNASYTEDKVEYIVSCEEGQSIPVFLHREVVWKADGQTVLPRNEEETTIGAHIYDSVENPLEVKQLLSDQKIF
jgi:hypothetical protein